MNKDRELYASVRIFSQAVNKCQPFERTYLPHDRIIFIVGQVTSEMFEMNQARSLHVDDYDAILLEQLDAVVDAMYYTADSAARHGLEADASISVDFILQEDANVGQPMWNEEVKRFGKAIVVKSLPLHLSSTDTAHETILWQLFCKLRADFYSFTGIDPLDYFEIVHQANLSKLDENGRPHKLREDGKIMKPDNFVPPNGLMRGLLFKQLAELEANN